MDSAIISFSIKDFLLLVLLLLFIGCLIKIKGLKKLLALETKKRLLPLLSLELILDKDHNLSGLYLKNESFFLAKEIEIDDVHLSLEDYGFKQNLMLRFAGIGVLKPKERIKLETKVFNEQGDLSPNLSESILPHLISPEFQIKISYVNIENQGVSLELSKKKDKFYLEKLILKEEQRL